MVGDFAEDDDAGGAAVDAECAAGADVFVDDEEDVVFGVVAGLVGVDGFVDGVGGEHVDAFPRADVDAAFAEDAFGLVDVQELLGLHRLGEPLRVDLLQHVRVENSGIGGFASVRAMPIALSQCRHVRLRCRHAVRPYARTTRLLVVRQP